MRIVLVLLGLAAIVAGCVSSGAASPEPSVAPPTASLTLDRSLNPSIAPSSTASPVDPRPSPTQTPLADVLPVGAAAITVADDLRVRSQPWIGDDSVKYEPLLPIGTELLIDQGPVAGSGYWWYRVQLRGPEYFELTGEVDGGWVAAADHDGTPWIDWDASEVDTDTDDGDGLLDGMRPDLQRTCRHLETLPPGVSAGAECEPANDLVAAVRVYLFSGPEAMLAWYRSRIAKLGIAFNTSVDGGCETGGTTERSYTPGGPASDAREACRIDAAGAAHLVFTSVATAVIEIDGTNRDVEAIRGWAWGECRETPCGPSLWLGPP